MANTRQTYRGMEIEVEKNGKKEWRQGYVETNGFGRSYRDRDKRVLVNSLKPVLYAGEMLMETIEGRMIIVQGKL